MKREKEEDWLKIPDQEISSPIEETEIVDPFLMWEVRDQKAAKLDKLPEYLRETVDWFMGKTRKRGDKECCGDSEQKLYLQEPLLECRVQDSELNFLTDLPGGLDFNEWLASHTIGFFEHINLIYGTISEFCTPSSCPDMVGPGPRQYLWVDEKGKKTRLTAPQYVDLLMTYVQKTINDETIFPTKHGNEFPSSFESHVRRIHRLLWHVLAHVYHAHFREMVLLQLHAHLNAVFAHFVEFHLRFHTLEDKELEVLEDLIIALKLVQPDNQGPVGQNHASLLPQNNNRNNSDETTAEMSPSNVGNGNADDDVTSGPCDMEEADPEADVVDGSPMDVVNAADDSVQNNCSSGSSPAEDGSTVISGVTLASTTDNNNVEMLSTSDADC